METLHFLDEKKKENDAPLAAAAVSQLIYETTLSNQPGAFHTVCSGHNPFAPDDGPSTSVVPVTSTGGCVPLQRNLVRMGRNGRRTSVDDPGNRISYIHTNRNDFISS